MKLASSSKSNGLKKWLCRSFRVSSKSTKTLKLESLYSRISPSGSLFPVLEQWIEQGNGVDRREINSMIKQLTILKRFKHALELSRWMSDQKHIVLSPGDVAVKLGLIAKVHGVESAEKDLDNIPKQSRYFPVYNKLLHCYAQNKCIEKAEALMQQMRDLGFLKTPLAYNVMLTLYGKAGQYEKLDLLFDEMKEKGVPWDKFTFCFRLNAYANTSEIDGMEKTLERMEVDPVINMDWNCYAIAANGYIKSGLNDKALEMLKKSEELTSGNKKTAYESLLKLYAAAGSNPDMYRIWNLYKSLEKVDNSGYICMVTSLLKLDDTVGAEKILDEWESRGALFDFRVPNMLLSVYCENGLLEKAEMFIKKAVENGKKPFANTWDIMATGYVKANQMPKAVEAIKAAYLVRRPGWKPNRDTLAACLSYLKEADTVKTEEFVRLLGAPGHMSTDDIERLLDYVYIPRNEDVNKVKKTEGDEPDDV